MKQISKLLVANRGESAIRIFRAALERPSIINNVCSLLVLGECIVRRQPAYNKITHTASTMDIYDYNQLSLGERASLLWQQALYLDRHSDAENTSNLYHINNFFIEAVVSHRENRIIDVTPFKMGERLEKYLTGVDIRQLI
jgi:hypothetical protein